MSDHDENGESSDAPNGESIEEPSDVDETPVKDPFDDEELFDMVSDASDEESGDEEESSGEKQHPADASEDDASEAARADDETETLEESSDGGGAPHVDEPDDDEQVGDEQADDQQADDQQADDQQTDDRQTDDRQTDDRQTDDSETDDPETDDRQTDAADGTDDEVEPADRGAPLLKVDGLKTYFYTKEGEVPAVDGVDFEIAKGETLGLVGESGSGKSVSALSVLRLVPDPPGKIVDGSIEFEGRDLTEVPDQEMHEIRGNEISMIFQEPMTSLNPVYTVGNQIVEAITLHQDVEYAEAREMAIGMLEKVGIPAPRERIDDYPHQMSGGMKQRVMIAMALACNPKLLIADEPTTALDVTIQAQILELLQELQDEMDMSVLFITHDLGVIAETCDYVAVMYGGRVVEYGDVETIFEDPSHPYTIGLFSSLPQIDVEHRRRKDRLYVIPGMVPSPQDFPSGCRFRDRCDYATEKCSELPPNKEMSEPGHRSLCWYAREVREGTKEKTGPHPEETADRETPEAAE